MSVQSGGDPNDLGRAQKSVVSEWDDLSSATTAAVTERPSAGFPDAPANRSPMPPSQPIVDTAPTLPAPSATSAPVQLSAGTMSGFAAALLVTAILAAVSGAHSIAGYIVKSNIASQPWRFGAVGASAPALFPWMISCAFATAAVLLSSQRILAWVLFGVQILGTVLLVALIPTFALDAIQVYPLLPSQLGGKPMLVNISFAFTFIVVSIIVLVTCAIAVRKHAKRLLEKPDAAVTAVVNEWDR